MEQRELYRQKYEAQLKEWEARFDALKARAQKTTADAMIELLDHLQPAQTKMSAARGKLSDMAKATDDSWERIRNDADAAWTEAKRAAERVVETLKRHDQH